MRRIHRAWYIFAACCIMAFVMCGLVINSIGLFHPYISQELNVSRTSVALTQTVQSVCGALSLMLSSRLLRKLPLQTLMAAGAVVISSGLMLASRFTAIFPFYIVWAGIGFFMPFLYSLTIPTVLANWFEKHLGTVLGFSVSLTGIGGAFFNPLLASFLQKYGWRPVLFAIGIFVAATLLPISIFIVRLRPENGLAPYGRELAPCAPAAAQAHEQSGISARQARAMPSFYLFIAAVLFLGLPGGFFQQVSPHVMSLGHPVTAAASVMSGVMFGIAAGKVVVGYLLDRFSAIFVISGFTLVGAAGWIGMTVSVMPSALIAFGFCAGMGHGISQVALPVSVRRTFGTREYSKIFSIISSVAMLVSSSSPTAGSFIFDLTGSYVIPLRIAGSAFFIALPCLIFALRLSEKGRGLDTEH